MIPDRDSLTWVQAKCETNACVQAASAQGEAGNESVVVRSSMDPEGPILEISWDMWNGLVQLIKNGDIDEEVDDVFWVHPSEAQ